jgi:hypothetical protein
MLGKRKGKSIGRRIVAALVIMLILISAFVLTFISPSVLSENFGSNIRVDDTGIDITNQTWPDIAVLGNNIYAVWMDNRLSSIFNTNIYFSKSTNNGISFEADIRIDDAPIGAAASPSIAVDKSNGNIYVVWQDYRNSPSPYSVDIYFANSTDGGNTFGTNKRAIDETGANHQFVPDVAAHNGFIGVVWEDQRGGIYFANSTDGGNTFGESKKVSDNVGSGVFYPKIAIDDIGIIYVVWEDKIVGNYSIYFSKSVDAGNTWAPSKKVSDDPLSEGQRMPSIALDASGNIYVVWRDSRQKDPDIFSEMDIYFAKSTDGGNNFTPSVQITDDIIEDQMQPSIAINDDGKIFVTWMEDIDFPNQDNCCDIYFANSTDGGNTFSTKQKINNSPSFSSVYYPSNAVVADGIHAYIVWQDDRNGNWDIYFTTTNFPPPIEPPTILSAELTGDNLENVTISWDASLNDSVEVGNYAVYYDTSYESNGLGYDFLTEVPASGASRYYLTVQGIGEGDPNNYFFYVQANSTTGFGFARNDTQVAKFTRSLAAGTQLVSIPLVLNNTNIPYVLQTIDFEAAWYYNNTDILDPWKSYNPAKSLNDLTTIDRTMAFWVRVTEDSNLTVAGVVPKATDIELKSGWNFVGYPSFIERNVSVALTVPYQRIEGPDNAPPQNLKLYLGDSIMRPGFGFWVKVQSNQTWTLIND